MIFNKDKFLSLVGLKWQPTFSICQHCLQLQQPRSYLRMFWRWVKTLINTLQIKTKYKFEVIDRRYEAEGVSPQVRRMIYMAVTAYLAFSPGLANIVLLYTHGIYIPFTPTAEALGAYFMGIYIIRWVRFVRLYLQRPIYSWKLEVHPITTPMYPASDGTVLSSQK